MAKQLESLREMSSAVSNQLLGEEAATEPYAAQMIEERYRGIVNHLKFEESNCRALKADIDNAMQAVRARRES